MMFVTDDDRIPWSGPGC